MAPLDRRSLSFVGREQPDIPQVIFCVGDFLWGRIFRLGSEDAPLACVPSSPSLTGSGSLSSVPGGVFDPEGLFPT